MNPSEIETTIQAVANGFSKAVCPPILRTPADEGLEFEDVTFSPADDSNIKLAAWYIPCKGSNKLVIANHPMCFNKYGLPAHLPEYHLLPDNNFEVNFIPDYKHLHDAGYNVLVYDIRNFGDSSKAKSGVCTVGIEESNDVIASVNYAKEHKDLSKMDVFLYSRCMGANSTIFAIAREPKVFKHVKAAIFLQPLSMRWFFLKTLTRMGLADHLEDLNKDYKKITGYSMDDPSPVEPSKKVEVPCMFIQVKDDVSTDSSDVQSMYDNVPCKDKKLFWIEGTTRRFDGYTYLPEKNPQLMIDWFNSHN